MPEGISVLPSILFGHPLLPTLAAKRYPRGL